MNTTKTTKTTPKTPTSDSIRTHIQDTIHRDIELSRKARTALEELVGQLQSEMTPAVNPADIKAECYESGNWEPYRKALESQTDNEQANQKLTNMVNQIKNFTIPSYMGNDRQVRRDHADDVLAYLASLLPSIMDAAAAIDLEQVPDSAEQAIALGAGAIRRWEHAAGLVDAYATLRKEQVLALSQVIDGPTARTWAARTGQYRNSLHTDPSWIQQRTEAWATDHRKRFPSNGGAREFLEGAPAPTIEQLDIEGFPAHMTDPKERLTWLHHHAHELDWWVPSEQELRDTERTNTAFLHPGNWYGDGFNMNGDSTARGTSAARRALTASPYLNNPLHQFGRRN